MNIAVAGLGLIGGSIAKALKAKTTHYVTGLDHCPGICSKALEAGAVDSVLTNNLRSADIVIVALYPKGCVDFIGKHLNLFRDDTIIVDLCGVKRYVCDAVTEILRGRSITFIGGHPMAGRECSGFDNSSASLFEGASMILTPVDAGSEGQLMKAQQFFLSLGFREITVTTPEHHDEMIALTSQLAHIVSSAYVQSPLAERHMGFSAGSFGDMTRVAKLNEDMWTELFLLNRDYLCGQIDVMVANLVSFRDVIANGEAGALHALLQRGRVVKENLSNGGQ